MSWVITFFLRLSQTTWLQSLAWLQIWLRCVQCKPEILELWITFLDYSEPQICLLLLLFYYWSVSSTKQVGTGQVDPVAFELTTPRQEKYSLLLYVRLAVIACNCMDMANVTAIAIPKITLWSVSTSIFPSDNIGAFFSSVPVIFILDFCAPVSKRLYKPRPRK